LDKPSELLINKLHPKVRQSALDAFADVETKLTGRARCRVTSTWRTFAEQTKLYAQGRTTPGTIVTNAKAGSSFHNFALALDFCLIVDTDGNGTYETTSWDTSKDYDKDLVADWTEVVTIFKKYKFLWGGDWNSFKDLPHVEKSFGYTVKQLNALHQAKKVDKGGYVLL
jgi:peptidoglycan L-alanyl-D-glutamate endopeptidase CwlK